MPAARLFTREMNAAIFKGTRSQKPILPRGALREEISHWLFLETYDNPLPWRDERHIPVSVAKDASVSGWGGYNSFSDPSGGFRILVWGGADLGYSNKGSDGNG